jgi:putative protein-disulfide isomerase
MAPKLYYFHDPMCSWCWAFRPLWNEIIADLPDNVNWQRILGGLAADTDQAMPMDMQIKLQTVWQKIQQTVPGTQFNFDFWVKCKPRRSTYAACRAVIAARKQEPGFEEAMILAIQSAYYLEARNPADVSTLVELATKIGLDRIIFSEDMESPAVQQMLLDEIDFTRKLEVKGFPSLILKKDEKHYPIQHQYGDVKNILHQIRRIINL